MHPHPQQNDQYQPDQEDVGVPLVLLWNDVAADDIEQHSQDERENIAKDLEEPVKLMITELEEINKEELTDWDGDQDNIIGIELSVEKLTSGKY